MKEEFECFLFGFFKTQLWTEESHGSGSESSGLRIGKWQTSHGVLGCT